MARRKQATPEQVAQIRFWAIEAYSQKVGELIRERGVSLPDDAVDFDVSLAMWLSEPYRHPEWYGEARPPVPDWHSFSLSRLPQCLRLPASAQRANVDSTE